MLGSRSVAPGTSRLTTAGTVSGIRSARRTLTSWVRYRTQEVKVRLAERIPETVPAVVKREVPGATERLPSMALGSQGGGQIAIDPRDTHGVTALQKGFQ